MCLPLGEFRNISMFSIQISTSFKRIKAMKCSNMKKIVVGGVGWKPRAVTQKENIMDLQHQDKEDAMVNRWMTEKWRFLKNFFTVDASVYNKGQIGAGDCDHDNQCLPGLR